MLGLGYNSRQEVYDRQTLVIYLLLLLRRRRINDWFRLSFNRLLPPYLQSIQLLMRCLQTLFILQAGLCIDLPKECGHSEEGFTLVVKEGQLGLYILEPHFLPDLNSLSDFLSKVELFIQFCQDVIF